jgi:protease-4
MNNIKFSEKFVAGLILFFCFLAAILGFMQIKPAPSKKNLVNNIMGDKVAVLALEGIIYESIHAKTPFKTTFNASNLKDELNKALKDKQVKAVLIRVNSPGGTVGASQEIFSLIQSLKKSGKPTVISIGDVCASGCYYLASASDAIVANRGSITGSIGVISQGLNFKGLLDKLGIVDQTFKTGKFKDLASPTRTLNVEEKELVQSLINDSYEQFIEDVSKSRKINITELRKHAQGQVYTGKQAIKIKLVDHLGTYEDSKNILKEILKTKYSYKHPENLYFDETWNKKNLSSFDSILDLGLSDSLSSGFMRFFSVLGNNTENHPSSLSYAKILWLN